MVLAMDRALVRRDQFGDADQIVGDQAEYEIGSNGGDAAARLRDAVALVPRGASVDGAAATLPVEQPRKLLFLAIAERISQSRMLHILADLGARDGFLLDGGGSSTMAIGQGSTAIPATVLLESGRPVATYIGVRAPPCRSPVNMGFCD